MPNLRNRSFVWCEIELPANLQLIETAENTAEPHIVTFLKQFIKSLKNQYPWLRHHTITTTKILDLEQMELSKRVLSRYWAPPKESNICLKPPFTGEVEDTVSWEDLIEPFSEYDPDGIEFNDQGEAIRESTPPQVYTYLGYQKHNQQIQYMKAMLFTWV